MDHDEKKTPKVTGFWKFATAHHPYLTTFLGLATIHGIVQVIGCITGKSRQEPFFSIKFGDSKIETYPTERILSVTPDVTWVKQS